jgi:hypothetical protein
VVTRIYHSTTNVAGAGRVFTNLYPVAAQGPVGVWKGAVAWGDYDNDNDLDLLVTGQTTNNFPFTKVYRNNNGSFVDSGHALPALRSSFAAWGDYNFDGNLDLALSGLNASSEVVSHIYRNFPTPAADPKLEPYAPAGLTNVVTGKSVRLSWTAPAGPGPSAGLTYNLRLGTSPGAANIVNPLSLPSGVRKVAARGNADERLSWTITNLTGGTFYWDVQAVDQAFAGSAFSYTRGFVVSNRVPAAVAQSLATTEDAALAVNLSGSDPDNDPLTFRVGAAPHFGQLTGTPPNLTYRPMTNYFGFDQFTFQANDRTTDSAPAVVYISVAPVPDVTAASMGIQPLAGGQMQVSLVAEPWRSYRLEASTDLVHWVPVAHFVCTNLLTLLIDADAAQYPKRFYRAGTDPLAAKFDASTSLNQEGFYFTVTGEVGRNYQVQVSSNLLNWAILSNVLQTNALTPFVDREAGRFDRRFYRIVTP